jgi:hypothetical protein
VSVWLTYNTLRTNPVEAVACLMILTVGLPLYFLFRSKTVATPPQQVVAKPV